jgi:hypothetical protein
MGQEGQAALLGILAGASERLNLFRLRLVANLQPVFLSHVVVYLDGRRVQGVGSVFLTAGSPILLSRLVVAVISFESAPVKRVKASPLYESVLPVLENVKRPIRAGPKRSPPPVYSSPPLYSTYIIRV